MGGRVRMRIDGWETRLADVVEGARERPFSWGQHDCLTFACDCVRALTGSDPMADWRGQYNSRAKAHRILSEGGGPFEMIDRHMVDCGGQKAPSLHAKRGDVIFTQQMGAGNLVMVCQGALMVGPSERPGLLQVPIPKGGVAWSF